MDPFLPTYNHVHPLSDLVDDGGNDAQVVGVANHVSLASLLKAAVILFVVDFALSQIWSQRF